MTTASELPTVPYGAWPSPITADALARAGVALQGVALDGDDVWWLEGRPTEGGRDVLVRRDATGTVADVTPPGFDVRTRVHEYGGGAWLVRGGTVWFSNFADQRLYRQRPGTEPEPITPAPPVTAGHRYADADLTPDGGRLYAVRERHEGAGDPVNEIVSLPADGSGDVTVVAGDHDFVSSPRVSPDGGRLCWLAWDHPNMPWDGTTLYVADLDGDGLPGTPRAVLGGPRESVFQPSWSPDGVLHAVSDASGWWNLYRLAGGAPVALHPAEAEFGLPQWLFGLSTYAFLDGGRIACVVGRGGSERLALLDADGDLVDAGLDWTEYYGTLVGRGDRVAFVAAAPAEPPAVVVARPGGAQEVLRRALDLDLDRDLVSVCEPVTFPTAEGREAYALYYPPRNPRARAPEHELPPLLVQGHGGPTSRAPARLSVGVQFWTSRGFAVLDVNYGGSTGYGRAYRERLRGAWGLVDVEDCVNAARHLVATGRADPERAAIRGGSAGGYTALAALVSTDAFAAGVSYYGVAELAGLARDTHKFESRYLDGLVGPWPDAEDTYRDRSPLHAADRVRCPVLLLQGADDPVVPPSQAEAMVEALSANGVAHAYVCFPGEQHGFRQASSITRAAECELSFYGQVFGFTPADDIEPVALRGGPAGPAGSR